MEKDFFKNIGTSSQNMPAPDQTSERLDFSGGLLIGFASAVALICLASGILRSQGWWNTAHTLFSSYGSILAGTMAIGAAIVTIQTMRQQIRQQQDLAREESLEREQSRMREVSRELQAGAMELLGVSLVLQKRLNLLSALTNSKVPLSGLSQETLTNIPLPSPLTDTTGKAMSHLRGSSAARTLSHLNDLTDQKGSSTLSTTGEPTKTRLALINAVSSYLSLAAMSEGYEKLANAKVKKRKTVIHRIEGENFNEYFKKIAEDGAIDLQLVEDCYASIGEVPPWKGKASSAASPEQ